MDMDLLPFVIVGLGIALVLLAVIPGGSKIEEWLGRLGMWHRLVFAAVGAAMIFAGWSMERNNPPVANFVVSPDGSSTQFGMQGLTNYSFDASSSSDLDNDRLTYTWDFGDSSTDSGEIETHVYGKYPTPRTFNVTLVVSDGRARSEKTTDVTVGCNIDRSYFSYPDVNAPELDLTQAVVYADGTIEGAVMSPILWEATSSVGGVRSGRNLGDVALDGKITSDDNFVCPCAIRLESNSESEQAPYFLFDGVLTEGADSMVGQITVRNIFEEDIIGPRKTYNRHCGCGVPCP